MHDWIRRSMRGVVCFTAMAIFISLAHSVLQLDNLNDEAVAIIGAALVLSGQWVSKFVNFYTNGPQSDDEE